uniref:Uncharacterized protein n=1 Tax=Anguilla anguilla TaxID=7936 RepID=A0A0E9VT50_ANGAN
MGQESFSRRSSRIDTDAERFPIFGHCIVRLPYRHQSALPPLMFIACQKHTQKNITKCLFKKIYI